MLLDWFDPKKLEQLLDKMSDEQKESFLEFSSRRKPFTEKNVSSFCYSLKDFIQKVYKEVDWIKGMEFNDLLNDKRYKREVAVEFDFDTSNEDHMKILQDYLASDKNYSLADYEVVGTLVRAIDYKPLEIEFECTSGFIVAENDMRDMFTEEEQKNCQYNVNATKGIIQTMEGYAKLGMLHGFVGNSCPSLYWSDVNNELHIGIAYEPCSDEDYNNDKRVFADKTLKEVGSICTDLWWYSIMDKDAFVAQGGTINVGYNQDVIEIPKGKYLLKHKYGITDRSYHENPPYATLTLIEKY
jgi:hypothetical protein